MIKEEILIGIQEDPLKKIRILVKTEEQTEKGVVEVEEVKREVEGVFKEVEDVEDLKEILKIGKVGVIGDIKNSERGTIKIKKTIDLINQKKTEEMIEIRSKIKILIKKIMIVKIITIERGFLIEGINLKNIIKKKDKKIAMNNWIDIPKIVLMKKEIINLKTIIKKKLII